MSKRKRTGVRKTPAGTWCVDYRDPLGIKRRKTFEFEREAVEFYERRRVKLRDGEYLLPGTWTIKQGAEKLLEKKAGKRFQTVAQLKRHIDKYINPALGELIMAKVTFEDIEAAGEAWSATLAPVTVNKLYGTISAIYKVMRRHGIKNNPMADVERKEKAAAELAEDAESGEIRQVRTNEVYSAEELKKLIEKSESARDRALHMTACLTGMRHGELNGLQWPCVDFKAGVITVRRSLTERPKNKGGSMLEPPKTKSGYRDIPISPELISELRRWKLACPPGELDLVFPNVLGGPASRKSNEKRLKRAMQAAELDLLLSMNNLRHSFASQHLAAGTAITEVSRMMGHASTDITLKVYSHWAKRETSTAASRLAARILGE